MERIELQGAWPPAGEVTWTEDLSECHYADVAAVANVIKSKKGAVLTQKVFNAQSADVLALYPDPKRDSVYVCELHQCKNWAKWPTAAVSFPSLGVDPSRFLKETKEEKLEGKGGFEQRKADARRSADRSRKSFERLRDEVKRLTDEKISFREEWVIDLYKSQDGAAGTALKKKAEAIGIKVMTTEFFEPTFSACESPSGRIPAPGR